MVETMTAQADSLPLVPAALSLREPVARAQRKPGTIGAGMTAEIERAIIRHPVEDVIRMLENEPVRADLVGQVRAAQVMNRVSIAHLSIERAMRFLITRAGGPLTKDHHLGDRLRELIRHEPESADFLIHAFQVAVQHDRFIPNVDNARHLKSLEF